MIPLSLHLSGFISYLEPASIDFAGFDLACISGNNGAGKSSLLDAMTWALFGIARKRDDSIIHSRAKKAEVCLDFRYEGNDYRILRTKTRDKPVSVEFFISQQRTDGKPGEWKPFTEKGTRETEARITETLHLDYDTFVNASFFLQGKADVFAQQRPADRKRILASILGLEMWDVYRDRTAGWRKDKEEEVTRLDSLIQEITLELNEEPERIRHLREVEIEFERIKELSGSKAALLDGMKQRESEVKEQARTATALAEQLDAARKSLDQHQKLLDDRTQERDTLEKLIAEAKRIEDFHQGILEATRALEALDSVERKVHELQTLRTAPLMLIERERTRLEAERDQLLQLKDAIAETAIERERRLEEFSAATRSLEELQVKVARRSELDIQIQSNNQEMAILDTENRHLRDNMNDLDARIQKLEPVTGSECPLCGQPLSPEDRRRLLGTLKEEGKSLGDRFRENTRRIKELGGVLTNCNRERASFSELDEQVKAESRKHEALKRRIEQAEQQLTEWQSSGAPKLDEMVASLKNGDYAPEAHADLRKLDVELAALSYDPVAHEATRLLVQGSADGEKEFHDLEKARATLAPLTREIGEIQEQLKRERSIVQKLDEDTTHARRALENAQSKLPDMEKAYTDWQDMQEKERQMGMEVGAARQKVSVLDKQRGRLAKLTEEREGQTTVIAELKSLERAFGRDGVPALLIEQALPEIEMQANELLDQLSDGNMSVRLSTQREYKDKGRDDKRETLDIIISDADGTRDYEMYSGGETFRVNFAIRLALSKVLAQRAGAKLQTLVIDEGFGSQDSIGRQRLIEAINTIKPDFAKILVITHMDELKDAFPTRIEIEKTPRGSTISIH